MPFKSRKSFIPIDTVTLVRALAIVLLVANHSALSKGLHGGLNGLLLVSGISMATFAFTQNTAHTLQSLWRFIVRIAVPSIILGFLIALLKGDVRWMELALISNWFTKDRIALFPIWYVQCMVQLLAFFALIFWSFNLTPSLLAAPVKSTSVALGLSVAICLGSYAVWDTYYLHDKLPHLMAWNLILGWLYWAMFIKSERTLRKCLIFTGVLLACEIAIFILAEAAYGEARIWWLTAFALILIWFKEIPLPRALVHILTLLSQATFYIFLLHQLSVSMLLKSTRLVGIYNVEYDYPVLVMACSLSLPVIVWVLVTATQRAFKKMQRERLISA